MPDVDVAVVIPALGRAGGLRVLIEWANRLADSGRRVAVVSAARGEGEDLDQSIVVCAPGRAEHLIDELVVRALRRTTPAMQTSPSTHGPPGDGSRQPTSTSWALRPGPSRSTCLTAR